MKSLTLALALGLLGCASLFAQDQHHGPVVYPSSNAAPAPAPATEPTPAAAPTQDMSVQATPTTPSANPPAQSFSLPPGAATSPLAGAPTGANGKPDDIYDIRAPYFYLKPLTWLWVVLGALAAIALIVILWIWLKPLRVLRAKTPYELALEKLEKARALLDEQNPEPYAVLVSETVRHYLSQRFRTPSTRRTTEEFLRQMQADASTPLLAAHRDLLRAFLEACDLVKFAHYQPGREELEQVQQRAISFVTATRPVEGAPA